MLLTCQAGYERLLARELTERGRERVAESGSGWVRLDQAAASTRETMPDWAFAHLAWLQPVEVQGDSVNALASRISEYFLHSLQGERVEAPWPLWCHGPAEQVGLGRRIRSVEAAFLELLRRKLARVARLAVPDLPRIAGTPLRVRGLGVHFVDFRRAFVARDAVVFGPRRMADDDQAPSRSYLKVEEAYLLAGREPQAGETVCDLGAAPGGWSYSAAKRGARVVAVDNGPMKGGALGHPGIEHRREDAFRFQPAAGQVYDWLFCDLVEEPHHVLRNLLGPWLEHGWCRRFVVNLKFGRVDPIGLLGELDASEGVLARRAPGTRVRHLFHDREEFTLVGELAR